MTEKKTKQLSKALIAGHVVECFDATIYGFYAVLLAPYFFPPSASKVFLSFMAFSAGFLVRPLGALFFGYLGDRFGRRKPLVASMALVGIPTIVIGFLPGYAEIGIASTLILFLCRCAQGFFYGAEFAGVNVYTYENFEKSGSVGAKTGILIAAGGVGAVIATGLGSLCTMEMMPAAAWRFPFLLGGIAAFSVFFWRKQLTETPSFIKAAQHDTIVAFPTKILWNYRFEILVSLFIVSLNTVPLYLVTVFGNHMFQQFGYSASESMFINMTTLLFDSLMIVLYAKISDRIGFKKQLIFGCLWLALCAFPSFYCLFAFRSILSIYIFLILISTGNALIVSCTMPYISQFFPTQCRFSAVALSSTLGSALIAGNTPFIASYLRDALGYNTAPALWLVFVSLGSLLGILYIEKRRENKEKSGLKLDFAITS